MTNPSSFFPDTFNLSDGPVQAVVTSNTDPRVVYDKNGFRATKIDGALVFSLDANAGTADFAGTVTAKGYVMEASGGVGADVYPPPVSNSVRYRTPLAGTGGMLGGMLNAANKVVAALSAMYNGATSAAIQSYLSMSTVDVSDAPIVNPATQVWMSHDPTLGSRKREVRVRARNDADTAQIDRLLLGSDGASDWLGDIVTVAPVTLATPGNGNVLWTTVDISAQIPAGRHAKAAILQVYATGSSVNDATNNDNYMSFRKDSGSQIAAQVGIVGLRNEGTAWISSGSIHQVIVPLTAAHKFDWQKTDGINAGSGISLALLGYILG